MRLVKLCLTGFPPGIALWAVWTAFRWDDSPMIGDDVLVIGLCAILVFLHTLCRKVRELPSLAALLFLNGLIAVPTAIVYQDALDRHREQLSHCKLQIWGNVGHALALYSADNAGHYPHSLTRLTPKYLKAVPPCPAAHKVTYGYIRAENPDAYTLWCEGSQHHEAGIQVPDYPQYSSHCGLLVP